MLVSTRFPIVAVVLLAALIATPVFAQGAELLVMDTPLTVCELPVDHPDMSRADEFTRRIRANYDPNGRSTATFDVTYNGFSQEAEDAFQFAVDIWEQHITSAITIEVEANWIPLGTNVLGSAGANSVFSGFPGQPVPNTWYANALADALSGVDQSPMGSTHEINANFSSNQPNWYFGTDGNTPAGQFDLVTVVLHELGHGLGFFGSMNVDDGSGLDECDGVDGNGCWGLGTAFPVIYDRFAQDLPGVSLINTGAYPNPSAILADSLQSNDVHFDGALVGATLGNRGPLYAPGTWSAGSSYSHWNEASFPAGDENSLMTPFVSPGESIHSPGPATCAFLEDIGWTLGTACAMLVANEPQATIAEGVTLGSAYPNPFTNELTLTLRVDEHQHVRATLYDLLGRRIAVLHDGPVGAGSPLDISVSGASLQPAVYFVRIEGEEFVTTQRIVKAQ